MDFKDGALVVQYKNALGEKVTEKISLREDSKAVQEMKERKDAEEKAFEDLRRLLVSENIPTNEIIARLKKGEVLDKEVEKVKNLSGTVNNLVEEKTKLQMQIEQDKKTHEDELKKEQSRSVDAEMALIKLENILNGAEKGGLMSKNFRLSSDDMRLALDTVQKQREKYNWIPEKK